MFAPASLLRIDPAAERLSADQLQALTQLRKRLAGDILLATTLSTSGHPGGSLSCLDALMMLYATANVKPQGPRAADRDRIVISNGHITPGVYSVLCAFGFDEREKFLAHFRHAGSRFGGHVETHVPGVEWNTGNLGQGVSAAVGSALAAKLRGGHWNAYVVMGDGEQQKGQVSEARRFAAKFRLDNLCVLVDLNGLQIGGKTDEVMPVHVAEEYRADGWNVVEVDGHDFTALHAALKQFRDRGESQKPTCIVLRTVMGKGVSFMENEHVFHGTTLSAEQLAKAFKELGLESELDAFASQRKAARGGVGAPPKLPQLPQVTLAVGEPRTYTDKTDNRSAYGNVLKDLAERNNGGDPKVLALSCDLEGSVKMNDFHKVSPRGFIEGGIQEHHMAAMAGRLSTEGFAVFFSTFGVFAGSEAYNQERLSDYNDATVKVVATHCGLDVGEDGPTHQAIDYVSLFANTFHFETFVPCDPNQTDRVIRYVANSGKPAFVAMGRSKLDIVKKTDGTPFWSGSAPFQPGGYDVLREGSDGAIIVMGTLTGEALKAHDLIAEKTGKRFAVFAVASLKPFSQEVVREAAKRGRIITLEDHHRDTGLGRLVAVALADAGLSARLERMGVAHYASSGAPADLFRDLGLDAAAVCGKACEMLALPLNS
jgi:transketolase